MNYRKIKIEYISDNLKETKQKIISYLNEIGIFEFELIDEFLDNPLDYHPNYKNNDTWSIIFCLIDNKYLSKKIDMIMENIDKIDDKNFVYEVSFSEYNEDEYKDEWKKYFKTTRIYENLVIKPSWDEYTKQEDDIVIEIDPGMAFGTGTHETTYLCIKEMVDTLKNEELKDKKLIDIGCGSGILMIVANKLGIENITGIDIDPKVENIVQENLLKNNIEKYDLFIGNLIDKENKKYNYIVSNILFDVLEKLLEDIKKICYFDTTLIFSGIINTKKEQFINKCNEAGFEVINSYNKNEWLSLKLQLKPKNIIAIDGPSSSGKSTIAEKLSHKMGYNYLNTGAMYRSYAYKLLKDEVNISKEYLLEQYINKLDLKIENNRFLLDNEDITDKLRDEKIGKLASDISQNQKIRKYMVKLQRELSQNQNSILDGRDIGSVVFPEAKLKIFLTASSEIRANRRYLELKNKNIDIEYEKILEDIKERDINDSTRKESPLMLMPDSITINTDNMSIDEIIEKIYELVKERDMI